MSDISREMQIIKRGINELLVEDEFKKRLGTGFPLRVKAGFDPTAPDPSGAYRTLNKLKQFQDMGHQIFFLIGDFTGLIGDDE